MVATYFHKRGEGHSIRGKAAREQGARAWSRLPANLKRGLTSKQAAALRISDEWHHAGKYASEVTVYYPMQVERFWEVIDAEGLTVEDLLAIEDHRTAVMLGGPTSDHSREVLQVWNTAVNAAEDLRLEITGEEPW